MRAVLLAAGRDEPGELPEPKCLHDMRGRSLLQRHLEAFDEVGIDRVTVVMGHGSSQLRAAVQVVVDVRRAMRRPLRFQIEPLFNEQFAKGSILSLHRAIDRLLERGGLWLEADLLYPPRLLQRLVTSPHPNAILVDKRLRAERHRVGLRGERVMRVAPGEELGDGWDLVGAFVGMVKVDAAGARVMEQALRARIDAGDDEVAHEVVLDAVLDELEVSCVKVDDLPWIDIDTPTDLAKANQLAIPIDRPA